MSELKRALRKIEAKSGQNSRAYQRRKTKVQAGYATYESRMAEDCRSLSAPYKKKAKPEPKSSMRPVEEVLTIREWIDSKEDRAEVERILRSHLRREETEITRLKL